MSQLKHQRADEPLKLGLQGFLSGIVAFRDAVMYKVPWNVCPSRANTTGGFCRFLVE